MNELTVTMPLSHYEEMKSNLAEKEESKGYYYIAFPKSLWTNNENHGVWDIYRNDNGEMATFRTVFEAKAFAHNYDGEHADKEFYVIEIKG